MNKTVSWILHSHLALLAGLLIGLTLYLYLPPHLSSPLIAITGASLLLLPVSGNFLKWAVSLVMQYCGAHLFGDNVLYPFYGMWYLNYHFLSCAVFGACLIFTAYRYEKSDVSSDTLKKLIVTSLVLLGYSWLVIGGVREMTNNSLYIAPYSSLAIHLAAVSIVLTLVAEKLEWQNLASFQMIFLPMLWACFIFALVTDGGPVLFDKGWIPWLVALFCLYRLLHFYDEQWPVTIVLGYHLFSLLLVLAILAIDLRWLGIFLDKSYLLDTGLALFLLINTVVFRLTINSVNWPFGNYRICYFLGGICAPLLLLGLSLISHLLDL